MGLIFGFVSDSLPRMEPVVRDLESHRVERLRRVSSRAQLSEAALADVPEFLLERSRARRAALTGADPGPAATPAVSAASTQAATSAEATAPAAAAAPKPAKVEKVAPWVEAAKSRPKIPVWAGAMLAFLPIWAIFYMTTNDPPSAKTVGPKEMGAATYTGKSCGGCHGPAGGGGVGPALTNLTTVFPEPFDQVRWVMLGTAGFEAEGLKTYGATKKPVGGVGKMPAQGTALKPAELLAVVRHERSVFSGEKFDLKKWEDIPTKMAADPNPAVSGQAGAYKTALDTWKTAAA